MKTAVVQIASFLFVALTPYASLAAFPLYVMANLLLGPASLVSLLVTSQQVGNTLEFSETGFARRVFQAWYWSNVGIAIPCISVALYLFMFGLQRGDHIVVRRDTRELSRLSGRIDLLIGHSKNDADPKGIKTLLAYIMYDPSRGYEKLDESIGDGRDVSVTNIRLNAKGSNTFSYGSIWNRTSDLLAVQDREFSRKDGNVFLILQTGSYPYDIIQLPETCHATEIDGVIRFAKDQCEKMGETRLRQLATR
ncbi:MAG: hypothetical protein FJ309_12370 [Planctomycetes bacterium]|nr:hypothetical protein [Planctomycetota bacterium]